MAQQVTITAKGLYLAPNDLGEVPDGALAQADNAVISKDGVIEARRGLQSVATNGSRRLFAYRDYLIGVKPSDGTVYSSADGVTWGATAALSISSEAIPGVIRAAGAAKNLYFPQTYSYPLGSLKISSPTGAASLPFTFPGLDITAALAGAGTALSNNAQVAYRVLFGGVDANGLEVYGAPSGRTVISNTSGSAQNVTVSFTNPFVSFPTSFLKVYRSPESPTSVVPSDEMGLVYQATDTGLATFTDIIPSTLLGASLYTSPSQEGLVASNLRMPAAKDIAWFRDTMFLADVTTSMDTEARLIATGATTGLQVNDTITLTVQSTSSGGSVPYTFTAKGAENYLAKEFKVFTGGAPAADIASTCESIVRIVNQNALGIYAFYRSGDDDAPGMIGFSGFPSLILVSFSTSRATAFIVDPKSTTTPVEEPNILRWSKPGQPEHFAPLAYAYVGAKENAIKRIVPTRDALFIFKDDGIWRLTGSGGVWDIQPLDPTMGCPAPESLVAFENAVFGLLDSGVARVTESGVEMVSTPIYPALEPLLAPAAAATLAATAFGIAYHSAHKYILWLPTAAGDTVAKQAYVYDSWTNAWTRWLPPTGVTGFYHGIVNPADDRLYMVDGTNVWQERKAMDDTDFQDGTSTPIPLTVKYAPRFGGNPGLLHQFREAALVFRRVQFSTASVGLSTNVSPAEETITLTGSDYGVSASAGSQTTIRALVPLEKARGSQLNVKFSHAQAGQAVQLQGLSVVFNPGSTRVGR